MILGDPIDSKAVGFKPGETLTEEQKRQLVRTNITEPIGSMQDPHSRITPFKIMSGIQPADAQHRYLLIPHLYPYDKKDKTAYWKGTDWQKAFTEGMQKAGLPYSGEYMWVATNMYWRIEHEVMPRENALSCVHCHESLKGEQTCDRCHQDGRNAKFRQLTEQGTDFEVLRMMGRDVGDLIGTTDYIDFKKLGYKGDPDHPRRTLQEASPGIRSRAEIARQPQPIGGPGTPVPGPPCLFSAYANKNKLIKARPLSNEAHRPPRLSFTTVSTLW